VERFSRHKGRANATADCSVDGSKAPRPAINAGHPRELGGPPRARIDSLKAR
jgi:hypothetical protein